MKKNLFLLYAIIASINSIAQNVGIYTTNPQATLDVRGSQRIGGVNNYIKFDSATGKIDWVGASLFTTTSQQIIKHSASSEGLYAGGGKLDYRNSSGTPVFYSDWTNGNGYFSGNLGIGKISPTAKLQIQDGVSGITPFFSARMVVETNSHTYINLLSPDPFETGILFGSGTNPASGVISYNTTNTPKGFTFSDNGNQTRMVIDNAGNVGIGTVIPAYPLDVTSNSYITGNFVNTASFSANVSAVTGSANTVASYGTGVVGYGGSIGIDGEAILFGNTGVRIGAYCLATHGNFAYGVYSLASGGATSSYAGYFTGDVYSSGTYLPSDRKLKTGITPLNGALSIINSLTPSVYTYRTNEYKQMQLPEGIQYGLIADEVQQVIPGIVKKAAQPAIFENHDQVNGKKLSDQVEFNAVNYTEIIPLLVGAIKEQQQQINELLKEIQLIKEKLK